MIEIYDNLNNEIYLRDSILYINLCNIWKFLEVFDILEIFSFILSKYEQEKIVWIKLVWECDSIWYLKRVNFLQSLEYLFWISNNIKDNIYTWSNDLLQEIKLFKNKNEFYWIWEKTLKMLLYIWLSYDTAYLVLSSLSELVDNSFYHNLWRWETSFWPLCIFLWQNYHNKRKLTFVINDLWVWFKRTLKWNYPDLETEEESIKKALLPKVTWRYQNKWWNGLVYLQKNIFNWFKWTLDIRSNDTLLKVESFWKTRKIKSDIDIIWTSIIFSLFY